MGDRWGGFFPLLLSPGFLSAAASSSPPDLTVAGERGGFERQGLGRRCKWFGMSERVVENKVGRAVIQLSGPIDCTTVLSVSDLESVDWQDNWVLSGPILVRD